MINNITTEENTEITNTLPNKITDRKQLIENVQQWVILEEQLRIINEKTKKIRERKNNITTDLCNYMNNNNFATKIGISNGELRFYEKKEYTPLTFCYIERCLGEIIPDKSKVDYIMKHIKDKREVTNVSDIRRVYTKI